MGALDQALGLQVAQVVADRRRRNAESLAEVVDGDETLRVDQFYDGVFANLSQHAVRLLHPSRLRFLPAGVCFSFIIDLRAGVVNRAGAAHSAVQQRAAGMNRAVSTALRCTLISVRRRAYCPRISRNSAVAAADFSAIWSKSPALIMSLETIQLPPTARIFGFFR